MLISTNLRELPWSFGTDVSQAQSVKEALSMSGLDWEVKRETLYLKTGSKFSQVPVLSTVRQSDKQVLGVISPRYTPVDNLKAFKFLDKVIDDGAKLVSAGQVNGGAKVFMLAELPKKFILKEEVDNFILFVHGFDGKTRFKVINTPVRFVCYNTLERADGSAESKFSTNHTGEFLEDRIYDVAEQALDFNYKFMQGLEVDAEVLSKAKLDVDEFIKNLYQLTDDMPISIRKRNIEARDAVKEAYSKPGLKKFRGTAWGVYNAAIEAVQHTEPKRRTKSQEGRIKRIITGTTENNRIMNLINEMIGRTGSR